MAADTEILESLSRLALFADLDRERLAMLLAALQDVSYEEGTFVVRRGDEDAGLHLIVEGEAGVVLDDEQLDLLPKGSFFGEISALLGEPTVADVIARSRLRCLFLPSGQVTQFLLENPHVMLRMLQTEARRLRASDERRT